MNALNEMVRRMELPKLPISDVPEKRKWLQHHALLDTFPRSQRGRGQGFESPFVHQCYVSPAKTKQLPFAANDKVWNLGAKWAQNPACLGTNQGMAGE
jgi:hypothetical protein